VSTQIAVLLGKLLIDEEEKIEAGETNGQKGGVRRRIS
jgi:hypothetical protein